MHIVVCVKDVFHPHDLRLPANGQKSPDGLRMPNRADECAVELAVRLRDQEGGRVTLLSIAPPEAEETLESLVGLGADALVRVWEARLAEADVAAVASVLAAVMRRQQAGLALCGDRAVGGAGTGLTGPLLAEILGWPFVGGAVALEAGKKEGMVVTRLIERGDRQVLYTPLPAVVAVSPEALTPGYPALAKIRRAKREVCGLEGIASEAEALSAPLPMTVIDWAIAKPRPRKLFAPPSTASAADRLKMVMGGGMAKKAQDSSVEAPPEKAAEQILQFLRQEKLI
ncbi:MAG TPA: hypothetical protein VFB21_00990 [Chthonomonadaceae bacterium]|nr:hypothetical protein [Chthonomonadaceae bacterium]